MNGSCDLVAELRRHAVQLALGLLVAARVGGATLQGRRHSGLAFEQRGDQLCAARQVGGAAAAAPAKGVLTSTPSATAAGRSGVGSYMSAVGRQGGARRGLHGGKGTRSSTRTSATMRTQRFE